MRRTRSVAERAWSKFQRDPDSGCWVWTGYRDKNGYGKIWMGHPDRSFMAHRVMYELIVGPIPTGLQIDHLCRNTSCVNPSHLEPVTAAVNTYRAESVTGRYARAANCSKCGLPLQAKVGRSRGGRECRPCVRRYQREWDRARRKVGRGRDGES